MSRSQEIGEWISRFGPVFCIGVSCLPAPSPAADDASRKCAPGIYCVEQMLCIARIDGKPPDGMNPNFFVQLLTLRSLKFARKDKTFVDGLMMDSLPLGNDHPNITMAEAQGLANWTDGQYGPPARIKDDKNVSTGGSPIGFSNGLSLTIEAAVPRRDHRFDVLRGSETFDVGPPPHYKMNYGCQAMVVDAPSLVVDCEQQSGVDLFCGH